MKMYTVMLNNIPRVAASANCLPLAAGRRVDSRLRQHCFILYALGAQGVLPMMVGGATRQLDLSSLTPLSAADCGRLQLGVPH